MADSLELRVLDLLDGEATDDLLAATTAKHRKDSERCFSARANTHTDI
ncbi:MAG: hypothetical protein OXI96_09605 [Acidimicrobiaceae bacterium]|nr:hypothetical protein [Acidimicrobiaceae bacterium]